MFQNPPSLSRLREGELSYAVYLLGRSSPLQGTETQTQNSMNPMNSARNATRTADPPGAEAMFTQRVPVGEGKGMHTSKKAGRSGLPAKTNRNADLSILTVDNGELLISHQDGIQTLQSAIDDKLHTIGEQLETCWRTNSPL